MLKVELVDKMVQTDPEFKELFKEHVGLEQDLEALYSLKYFPPEVEAKIKEIKKMKLVIKDQMELYISQHRSENS